MNLQAIYIYINLQARILELVAIPFSRGIFPTQGLNPVSCIASRSFTISATREGCVYKLLNCCAVNLNLTQHCKSITLQFKKERENKTSDGS